MAIRKTFDGSVSPHRVRRNLWSAVKRGWFGRCPNCGEGRLFRAFLKPVDSCSHCHEEMHHQRADDFPPYLVIFVVGHIVVGGYLMAERMVTLNSWQHLAIWAPMTVLMAIVMMQPTKGAVIGMQWANYMHGFGGEHDAEVDSGTEPS